MIQCEFRAYPVNSRCFSQHFRYCGRTYPVIRMPGQELFGLASRLSSCTKRIMLYTRFIILIFTFS